MRVGFSRPITANYGNSPRTLNTTLKRIKGIEVRNLQANPQPPRQTTARVHPSSERLYYGSRKDTAVDLLRIAIHLILYGASFVFIVLALEAMFGRK